MDRKEAERIVEEHKQCNSDYCEDPEQLAEALRALGRNDAASR